jgi:hypothetical protein
MTQKFHYAAGLVCDMAKAINGRRAEALTGFSAIVGGTGFLGLSAMNVVSGSFSRVVIMAPLALAASGLSYKLCALVTEEITEDFKKIHNQRRRSECRREKRLQKKQMASEPAVG